MPHVYEPPGILGTAVKEVVSPSHIVWLVTLIVGAGLTVSIALAFVGEQPPKV